MAEESAWISGDTWDTGIFIKVQRVQGLDIEFLLLRRRATVDFDNGLASGEVSTTLTAKKEGPRKGDGCATLLPTVLYERENYRARCLPSFCWRQPSRGTVWKLSRSHVPQQRRPRHYILSPIEPHETAYCAPETRKDVNDNRSLWPSPSCSRTARPDSFFRAFGKTSCEISPTHSQVS
jgi:hypothetical protein